MLDGNLDFTLEPLRDKVVIFRLIGECGTTTDTDKMQELRQYFITEVKQNNFVIMDMTQVTYVDAAGFSLLLAGRKWYSQHEHRILLFGLQKAIKRVMQITCLDQIFDIFDTYDEALAFINSPAAAPKKEE